MTTLEFAKREFDLLRNGHSDAIVLEFEDPILSICEEVDNAGLSGASASYYVKVITSAIKKLLNFEPIVPITDKNSEWVDISEMSGEQLWQNSRCGGLFKDGKGNCYYLDAIHLFDVEARDTFAGVCYLLDNEKYVIIKRSQRIKSVPFLPKTFTINVEWTYIDKGVAEQNGLPFDKNGNCYIYKITNPQELDAVYEYYEKPI